MLATHPEVLREWPVVDDTTTFIWIRHWSCGCLMECGYLNIAEVESDDRECCTYRYEKDGKAFGVFVDSRHAPTLYEGALLIDGLIRCDLCGDECNELALRNFVVSQEASS